MRQLCCVAASLLGFLLVGQGTVEAGSQKPQRPNILFVFADDHATHAISAYGSRIVQTPNIDRLAKEGMLFRNCFVTNSICAPSRAVILTGKHSHLNGVLTNGDRFDVNQQTFVQLLKKAGYQTAIVGKWHLQSDPVMFDYWRVLIGQGPYYNPRFRTPKGPIDIEGYTTDVITDLVLEWLQKERDPDKPFFLAYQHKAPHREWLPGPNQLHLFRDTMIPEPTTLFDDYRGRTSAAGKTTMTIAQHMTDLDMKFTLPKNLTAEQRQKIEEAYREENEAFRQANLQGVDLVRWRYQRYIKDYLRCITAIDQNLGRVLEYLDRSGLAENTVVIYSSDQGFFLGDHGWYDKRWMYEESLRMPLIVRWPGVVKPGSVNWDLVQNLDFAPTFLEIAGVEVPADMQGRSLLPLLRGERPADWRESIYYRYYEYPAVHDVQRHEGVRTQRYKLIHYYLIDEWELFDLERDPDELQSVYGRAEYAEVQEMMKAELDRLRSFYGVDKAQEPPLPASR
jgi:arylsulfatase A-like enzyme